MTITEHLRISVLSAPIAASDRRALSQAWYSALYAANRSSLGKAAQLTPPVSPPRGGALRSVPAQNRFSQPSGGSSSPRPAAGGKNRIALGVVDRRAPRIRLAGKIEELVLQPRPNRRAATFVLDGARGRVRVLVRADRGRLRLIAICSERARTVVAAALAQARYALAARSDGVEVQLRESAC